jgi:serine/threonine protein kinase
MSPELLERKPYNVKTDIWALGCSIYELATFSTPYEAPNMKVLLDKIRDGLPQRIDKTYSDELWNIISKMLTYDYNKRPSSLELIDDCCRIFVSKNRKMNYNQKKWEELLLFKQQLQKKEEELREKEKIINNREYSVNILAEKLKKKEEELIKKEKELEKKYKKFEENKKGLNEMKNEKEIKMKELNNQENINKNQENIPLNWHYYSNNVDSKNSLLNNEVNLKDENNNYICEYNNDINKNNSNYNISNNQNNYIYKENGDDLLFTHKHLEQYLKNKKNICHDNNALDLINDNNK